MEQLYKMIKATQPGDFIHATAWQLNLDTVVLHQGTTGASVQGVTIGDVLLDAQAREFHMRLLLTYPQDFSSPVETCKFLNKRCQSSICCATDARHVGPEASIQSHWYKGGAPCTARRNGYSA